MANQLSDSVKFGLKLSTRVYYGKDEESMSAPKASLMEKSSSESCLPTAPMVYAEIREPGIVDNPDISSYQPYVHGRCEPPALIPLHMHGIEMEVECYLETAFVTVAGSWRLHCVSASKTADCRIAIPMGEHGSVLGVEVSTNRRSFHTQLITVGDTRDTENIESGKDGCLLKRQIYTFKVFQVDGGSILSVKVRWSQKLVYIDGQFCLSIPFSFPAHVTPVAKNIPKREKILLNLNVGPEIQVVCKSTSHPLKELKSEACCLGFSYDAEVLSWSISDFLFSYSVCSWDISGGILLQSPSPDDVDQREMFCLYLFPGSKNSSEVFKKAVIFVVDISASMHGGPIEAVKSALVEALCKLNPLDFFNIIAFNDKTNVFSPSMELARNEAIENATKWITSNLISEGGTNISLPLNQAIKMVAETGSSIPVIFLITDGAVEDERDICNVMKSCIAKGGLTSPLICTFGIGSYCNHYFLRMLAQIGRGFYDAAYDADSINSRMQRLFDNASSIIYTNITVDAFKCLDTFELYPCHIPALSTGSALILSGRYHGNFPDSVKVNGKLSDLCSFVVDVKARKAKDFPLDKVLARRHIEALTSQAWFSGSKQLEDKIAKMSMQTGTPSEYTSMILVQTDKGKQSSGPVLVHEMVGLNGRKVICLGNMGVGFGNLTATAENLPAESGEPKLHEDKESMIKMECCGRVMDRIFCLCCIRACSQVNDQCAIALSQLCTALACVGCLKCCCELCDSCDL